MPSHRLTSARRVSSRAVLLAAGASVLLVASANARTHTFTVKTKTDAVHGSCGSKCSLRDAVIAADKAGGTSVIKLPAGTYKMTIAATSAGGTDNPAQGDLDIKTGAKVTVEGAGAAKTILNANELDREFAVHEGASLTVTGVTLENGAEPDDPPSDYGFEPGYGGELYNDGTLKLEKSVVTGATAYDGGGVIYADTHASSTTVSDTTVTHTSVDDEGGVVYNAGGPVTFSHDNFNNIYSYDGGGAIYSDDAGKLTVSHTQMTGLNSDDEGAAIYIEEGAGANITDSQFSHETVVSSYDGAAIYAFDAGRVNVTGSSFTDDTGAEYGGAIYTDDNDLTVTHSHFDSNQAESGGAIYVDGKSSTAMESISDSVFSGNVGSDDAGGAIYDAYGDLSINASTFSANYSYDGGGLFYDSGDALSLVNDTFDSNSAEYGGGIYMSATASTGTTTARNDTITRNVAYYGGGIAYPYEFTKMENSIVGGNVGSKQNGATTGSGDCYYALDYNAATADGGHNLDGDHSCVSGTTASGDKTGAPKLGPLKNNGGPVPTDALLSGSPAIGAADSAACPKTDARGVKRTGKCSIGAYQAAPTKKK